MHLYRSNINLKIDIPYSLPLPYTVTDGWESVQSSFAFHRERPQEAPNVAYEFVLLFLFNSHVLVGQEDSASYIIL